MRNFFTRVADRFQRLKKQEGAEDVPLGEEASVAPPNQQTVTFEYPDGYQRICERVGHHSHGIQDDGAQGKVIWCENCGRTLRVHWDAVARAVVPTPL